MHLDAKTEHGSTRALILDVQSGPERAAPDFVDVNASGVGDKLVGADEVERGDAEDLAGVVRPELLHLLGEDGDGRVDGVRDDGNHCVGACVHAQAE